METTPRALTRKIIHVDMDAFYASVEVLDNPDLKGKPLVVGGDPGKRGVVAAASYEARKFGIRSAMSSAKAQRLCPQLIFVKPRISRYAEVSDQIHAIFQEATSLIEPLSLDEAYLDVTQNLLGEPLAMKIAQHIKDRIRNELHLTASAGVGPNKFIAKVASDLRKPDGLVIVPPQRVLEFVAKLPIERLWGVGPATAEKLHALGFWTCDDIRKCTAAEMERHLGKFGTFLHGLAHGEDDREVESERESKSCGSETTFDKDILDTTKLQTYIQELAEEVSQALKAMGRPGKTITLKLKYADFISITRSRTLTRATDETGRIAEVATDLLLHHTEAGTRPARLIGVSVSGLWNPEDPEQLWLNFPPPWVY